MLQNGKCEACPSNTYLDGECVPPPAARLATSALIFCPCTDADSTDSCIACSTLDPDAAYCTRDTVLSCTSLFLKSGACVADCGDPFYEDGERQLCFGADFQADPAPRHASHAHSHGSHMQGL